MPRLVKEFKLKISFKVKSESTNHFEEMEQTQNQKVLSLLLVFVWFL